MQQYRKKPVVIEAVQFDGTREVAEVISEWSNRTIYPTPSANELQIPTLEGTMTALQGDYIIKGLKGEFYPCKPDIFEQTYSQVGLEPPCCLTFGQAIEALKAGKHVSREGWNGKGMYLWLLRSAKIEASWCKDEHLKGLAEANGGSIEALGSIRMLTATKEVLTGWLASQTDILAEDWCILN